MKIRFESKSVTTLLIGCLALLSACGGKGGSFMQQQSGPVEASTQKVGTASVRLNSMFPATIKGKTDVEVRPQITGTITRVCVDEGQRVSAGQPLFIIDQVQLEAAVRSAQAAVAAARSQVATARLTANNQKRLLEKNIISPSQYETAALSLQAAEAQLAQANAALVNARKNLSYAVVKAPSAGVVGTINQREGSLASPSTPLTTISDNSQVYAYFSIDENKMLQMTKNGALRVDQVINSLPMVQLQLSDGTVYGKPGKVSTVSGVLDASTGSASVRALFANDNGMLRSGASGTILLPTVLQNAIVIPQKATYEMQDMKYVYVLGDSSKAVSTPIKVLPENDGVNYVVTDGLKVGDVIVIEGVGSQVKDGVVIKPISSAEVARRKQQATKGK